MAYSRIDPLPPHRQDVQAALLASVVANAMRSKGRAYKIDDFLLRFDGASEQTPEQMEAMMMAWVREWNSQWQPQ